MDKNIFEPCKRCAGTHIYSNYLFHKSEGCDFCNDEFDDYDTDNCIYQEENGNFTLVLSSWMWDEYNDCFEATQLRNIISCPKCGRKLS